MSAVVLSASPCRQKCMQGDQGYVETAVHKEIQGGFIAHSAAKKKIVYQVKRQKETPNAAAHLYCCITSRTRKQDIRV